MTTPDASSLPADAVDARALQDFVTAQWDREIVPALTEYIAIPAKSPAFDADWAQHGHIDRVVQNAARWLESQAVEGLKVEILRLPGRTPVLYFDAPATRQDAGGAVLMYGHLDKQPEFSGWHEGLGPWTPVYRDGRLYGRGGADDGYATYASLTALMALDRQGVARPRCIGLIETCEESGSYDLLPYVDSLRARLGRIALVVCLDSGAGDYERLWMTTSLRGMAAGTLEVQVLEEGVHSGDASGVVPGSVRILRQLLDRVEDSLSGRLQIPSFYCDIPAERLEQAGVAAQALGTSVVGRFPWAEGAHGRPVQAMTSDLQEAVLNRTWRPTLTVIGADGIPAVADAGNVLRPRTALKLSLRLPPLADAATAMGDLKAVLERDPPYGARVRFTADVGIANGWNAPETAPWLAAALETASQRYFGVPCAYMGEGGTIPLMNTLRAGFPDSQFMVCGVLGPQSNAHGPNEFLHVPFAKRLTASVAQVIAALPPSA